MCLSSITLVQNVHIRVVTLVTHGETAHRFTKLFRVWRKNNTNFIKSSIVNIGFKVKHKIISYFKSRTLCFIIFFIAVTHGEFLTNFG